MNRTRSTSTPVARRTRTALALTALLAVSVLTGCGDDDGDAGDDRGSSPAPTEATEQTEPTEPIEPADPSESTEPAETGTPLGTGVAPADGPEVTIDALSLRLPQGWEVVDQDAESLLARPRVYNLDGLEVIAIQNDGRTSTPEQAYRDYLRTHLRPPTVEPTVEVDGVEMFHASGKAQAATWIHAFVSDSTSHSVWITFESSPKLTTAKQRRELADSVMASVDLAE